MNWPLMALLLVVVVGVWLILRRRKGANEESPRPSISSATATSAFHAVSIHFSVDACKAAKKMAGRRFLATAAPKLPLEDCDVLQCNCRFNHHKDRRVGTDRRNPFAPSGFGGGTGQYERDSRKGQDRRSKKDQDLS